MKYTKEHLKRLVHELRTGDLELSDWESSFLDSLAEQLRKGWTLSKRQLEIFERLRTEKMPS